MQLHIIGTNADPQDLRVEHELAVILNFLGVETLIEQRFSGRETDPVVLGPLADVAGIQATNPVLLLDTEGTLSQELVGSERSDGLAPVGIIRLPFSQEQIGTALRAVRSHNAMLLSPHRRSLSPAHAGILARLPGDHPSLDALRAGIAITGEQDGCVLICGETGTGKRLIADAIYQCSSYADGPFVPVSCATFPESLLAIELFGCESGALPGSTTRRFGRIEMAEGGVLLLEDVEALSIQSQASLLAFLRSKRLERVGSTRGAPCDVRLIASTSTNLETLVEQGRFREDLFYALQGLVITVPALRDYATAIPGILAEMDPVFQTGALSAEAWQALQSYRWPGNIKELRNFASQMSLQAGDGVIEVADLPPRFLGDAQPESEELEADGLNTSVLLPVNGLDLKSHLAALEKNLITQALEDTGFVVARAADRLHIRRTTLVEKMRMYGLQRT